MAKQQARVEALEKKVSDLWVKVASQEATINNLVKEDKSSEEMANTGDQEARGNAIRLFGLPVTQEINIPESNRLNLLTLSKLSFLIRKKNKQVELQEKKL